MKIYIVPEIVSSGEKADNMYSPLSWAETVVGSVAGGVASAVVGSLIPGPAIPG